MKIIITLFALAIGTFFFLYFLYFPEQTTTETAEREQQLTMIGTLESCRFSPDQGFQNSETWGRCQQSIEELARRAEQVAVSSQDPTAAKQIREHLAEIQSLMSQISTLMNGPSGIQTVP